MRHLSILLATTLVASAPAAGVTNVLKGYAASVLIRSQAGALDGIIDAVTLRHGSLAGDQTRVVPAFSVGRKAYVGAYQVAGPPEQVTKVRAVFEVTGQLEGGKGRFAHLIPSITANPLDIKRVRGVGVVAAVDASVWGAAGTHPVGGNNKSRLLRGAAAVAAAKLVGPEINRFLSRVTGHPSSAPTRVVPILTVGEKGYVGLAQVLGPGAERCDAVLQLEEVAGDRVRVRAMVPVDTGLQLKRLNGVGVGTVVDMVLKSGTTAPKAGQPAGAKVPVVPVVVKQPAPVALPPPPSGGGFDILTLSPGWSTHPKCKNSLRQCQKFSARCASEGKQCKQADKHCARYENECGPGGSMGAGGGGKGRGGKGKWKKKGRGGKGKGGGPPWARGGDDDDDGGGRGRGKGKWK
jgi:hypothetical protein